MADSLEVTPTDAPRAGPNSGQGRGQIGQVAVTFDADAGHASIPGEARAPARVDRSAVLAKFQQRIDSARGVAPDAVQLDERGQQVGADAVADEVPDSVEAEADDAGDVEAAVDEPVEAAADDGEAPTEVEAEPEKPAAEDPAYRYELEQARNEATALRQQFDDYVRGSRKQEFDVFFDDPVSWLKTKVAEVLEAKADDSVVGNELASLLGELTWHSVGVQDLGEAQQSQLRRDQADRRTRLDQYTRQTARRASQVSQETEAARNYTRSVYEAVKDKFPAAALAEQRYGRPIQDLVLARLPKWLEEGTIRGLDTKTPTDLLTEAIRLFDLDSRRWAEQLSPQLAHLTPATAPATPGASPKPAAPKAPVPPQAAPKGQPVKPRTLTQKQAGTAPSRPAVAPKVDEPLSRDPDVRRRQIIERAQRR